MELFFESVLKKLRKADVPVFCFFCEPRGDRKHLFNSTGVAAVSRHIRGNVSGLSVRNRKRLQIGRLRKRSTIFCESGEIEAKSLLRGFHGFF